MGFCLFVSMQQNPRWRVGLVFGTTGAPFEKETEPPDGGDQRGVSIVLPVCEPPRARPGLRLCLENRRSRLEDPQTDRVRDPTGRKRPGCKPHASHVAHRPVGRAVPRIAVRAAVACALLLANHRKPLPTSVRAADLLSGSRLFDLLPPGEIFLRNTLKTSVLSLTERHSCQESISGTLMQESRFRFLTLLSPRFPLYPSNRVAGKKCSRTASTVSRRTYRSPSRRW